MLIGQNKLEIFTQPFNVGTHLCLDRSVIFTISSQSIDHFSYSTANLAELAFTKTARRSSRCVKAHTGW